MRSCNICNCQCDKAFSALVLGKYSVDYYRCRNCGSMYTDEPFWLKEAYEAPIAVYDTGILQRNIQYAKVILEIMQTLYKSAPTLVDFGGGYGILVRLLRDAGIAAFWSDKYADNIFAKGFEFNEQVQKPLVGVALEVIEHLENPLQWFHSVLGMVDTLIFSTELVQARIDAPNDWWYFLPETGQHVFFASEKALRTIAADKNCTYYAIKGLHIISRDLNIQLKLEGNSTFVRRLASRVDKALQAIMNRRLSRFESLTRSDHFILRERAKKLDQNER